MKLSPTKNKLAAGIMLSLVCSGAWAADPFAVDSPWMLGDWGGTRSELHDKGIDFNVNYVMEAATNLGGYQKHTTARYTLIPIWIWKNC
ncbi:hypothetical protein DES37_106243 [Mangrovibacter plantisponsor]|uniref:Porin n=1 Tax=Mangrovibacter plantisponsor TaxID=451513 RepID=A0A317PZM2_9ENTR|nr:hypothetical protein DES37_106243 [Mangrovibacter plantisponsor]